MIAYGTVKGRISRKLQPGFVPAEIESAADKAKKHHEQMKSSRMARRKQLEENPDDPRHGTHSAYSIGCRCDSCKKAERHYKQKRASVGKYI